jgi:hypothetical protein
MTEAPYLPFVAVLALAIGGIFGLLGIRRVAPKDILASFLLGAFLVAMACVFALLDGSRSLVHALVLAKSSSVIDATLVSFGYAIILRAVVMSVLGNRVVNREQKPGADHG